MVFSGGEPTLYPNLSRLIRFAAAKGLQTKVNTNGWNTASLLGDLGEDRLGGLSLSLYSLDPDAYFALRGQKEMFHKALQAADAFGKQVQVATNTCSLVLQTIITNRNFRELPDIVALAIEKRFSAVAMSYLEYAYRHPELRLSVSEIRQFRAEVIPELHRMLESYPLPQRTKQQNLQTLAGCFDPKANADENWARGIYRPTGEPRCDQPGGFALVYADGLIAPCCGFEYVQPPEFIQELGRHHLQGVVQGEKFSQFAEDRMEFCRYCPAGMHPWLYLALATRHGESS